MAKQAFTLLEAVVYLALAAIFLGGVLSCAYVLVSSAGAEQAKILLQFEGQFLQGKFMWAFLGAKDFSLGQDGQTLTIDGYNSVRPVVFDCQNGSIRLTVNGDAPADLNAVAVTVGGLLLRDLPATAGQPEGVGISFVLKTLDSRGRLTGQNFSFTEYLKQ